MAYIQVAVTIGTVGANGVPLSPSVAGKVDGSASIATAVADAALAKTATETVITDTDAADDAAAIQEGALKTAVIAALAVLQADGALPTEAHVDDLQAAWDPLATAMTDTKTATAAAELTAADADTAVALVQTDLTAAEGAITGNVQFAFDTSVVTTKNIAIAALRALERAIQSGYGGLS